jgi:dTDP-4-amino-4,6-dideoxygalactose transaminase
LKYPFTRPLIPPPEAWTPYLEPAYRQRYFTNFGPVERQFCEGLAEAFARPGETCVVSCNATSALSAALLALGVRGPVVVPSFTFPATVDAIYAARCEPVLCDVEPDTWECSARTIRQAMGDARPAAIMPVRTFGLTRDLSPLAELARRWDAPLVIDAAAALGVDRGAQPELDCRYAEVFSLHATKPFGIGEGGAVFAPVELQDGLRSAINFGLQPDRSFGHGVNGKMSEFQAAVGLSVLETYRGMIEQRRVMVRRYLQLLNGRQMLSWPWDIEESTCATFPLVLPADADVDGFVATAGGRGALYRRYYHPTVAAGLRLAGAMEATPVAEALSSRMVCLPVYADASAHEQDELVDILSASVAAL